MNLDELGQAIWARLDELAVTPLIEFVHGLDHADRIVLLVLLAAALALGFFIGRPRRSRRRRSFRIGGRRFPSFQNDGEALVSRILSSEFPSPGLSPDEPRHPSNG